MKKHLTQKLFWKRWAYKAIIEIQPVRNSAGWSRRHTDAERIARNNDFTRVIKWVNENLPTAGQRREGNLSVFLENKEQLELLVDHWGHRVISTWEPESDSVKDMLTSHANDVVRARPWYGRFPIRARILYTDEFRQRALNDFKTAVNGLDSNDWHAKGMLSDLILVDKLPKSYAWGQPMHLYLASADDAAMLKLQCGDYIERFERIRPPE
jgi:hypothetical protein